MIELTDTQARMLERVPEGDDGIASSEVAHRLHEFATLHQLERMGLIEVVYEPDSCWVTRPEHTCPEPFSCNDPRCWP